MHDFIVLRSAFLSPHVRAAAGRALLSLARLSGGSSDGGFVRGDESVAPKDGGTFPAKEFGYAGVYPFGDTLLVGYLL